MLTTLNLKDFVIVDQLSLDLSTGFTVLTGETGAGKSILIDAIQLIRGARADADMVRKGAERANIIAEFMPSEEALRWLEINDLQDSSASTVLVRRSIDKNGRSRAWINGITVTLSQLKELGDTLVDIQGQHAHQLLLKTQNQLKLLDAYAENTAQLEAVKKLSRLGTPRPNALKKRALVQKFVPPKSSSSPGCLRISPRWRLKGRVGVA